MPVWFWVVLIVIGISLASWAVVAWINIWLGAVVFVGLIVALALFLNKAAQTIPSNLRDLFQNPV